MRGQHAHVRACANASLYHAWALPLLPIMPIVPIIILLLSTCPALQAFAPPMGNNALPYHAFPMCMLYVCMQVWLIDFGSSVLDPSPALCDEEVEELRMLLTGAAASPAGVDAAVGAGGAAALDGATAPPAEPTLEP